MATDKGETDFNECGSTRSFSAGRPEMTACPDCQRSNPQDRFECLYCGADLERDSVAAGKERFVIRKPEIWERAFNIIALPDAEISDRQTLTDSVAVFGISPEAIDCAKKFAVPFPLCRVSSRTAAEAICQRLTRAGVKCDILDDARLDLKKPPLRIRSLDFTNAQLKFVDFNTGETLEISRNERITGVLGRLFVSTIEQSGRRRKDAEQRPEITATSRDTAVLDIFLSDEHRGFRLRADGCDFSGLGREVKFLAEENMRILIRQLTELCPNATIDTTYKDLAGDLAAVWPPDVKIASRGIYRIGFDVRFAKGETTDNTDQFTRYSRMLSFYL